MRLVKYFCISFSVSSMYSFLFVFLCYAGAPVLNPISMATLLSFLTGLFFTAIVILYEDALAHHEKRTHKLKNRLDHHTTAKGSN
jgi:hypothetical protein